MGCVNGKHFRDSESESRAKAQNSTRKQRKSLRSYLRTLLFARKRSSNKNAPSASSDVTTSTTNVDDFTLPPQMDHDDSSDTNSIAPTHTVNSTEIEPKSGIHLEAGATELQQTKSSIKIPTKHSCTTKFNEKAVKLRKKRCRLSAIDEMETVCEIKAELANLSEKQDMCVYKIKLFTALRDCALLSSSRASAVTAAKLGDSIDKLRRHYIQYEKKLYKLKTRRSVGEAKIDHLAVKLNPRLEYTHLYAKRSSFYLSPIPEETEVDLDEFYQGVFPSETNESLTAVKVRQSRMFLDMSTSHDFIH